VDCGEIGSRSRCLFAGDGRRASVAPNSLPAYKRRIGRHAVMMMMDWHCLHGMDRAATLLVTMEMMVTGR